MHDYPTHTFQLQFLRQRRNRPYCLFTFDPMASFSCGIYSCFLQNRVKNNLVIGLYKVNAKQICAGKSDITFMCACDNETGKHGIAYGSKVNER